MKKIILIALSLSCYLVTYAQLNATKLIATKGNEYGLTYTLPKTLLTIDIQTTKITQKAGQFYQYAEKYLGITDAISTTNEHWTIDKIDVWGKGIPDKDNNTYLIQLKSGNVPYMYLTIDGLLCSINTEPDLTTSSSPQLKLPVASSEDKIRTTSVLSEELLMASSTSKMAEIAAKQIYRIRESRLNILTGEAEKMPGDGESFKLVISQLDAQEKALTEMFSGTTSQESIIRSYTIYPEDDLDNHIVCRFSKHLGLVDKNDLSGTPIYLILKNTTTENEQNVDFTKEKSKKGIVYNIPGEAEIKIIYKNEVFSDKVLKIAQFGTTNVMPSSIFEDKKNPAKVILYPDLGAVKEIMQ